MTRHATARDLLAQPYLGDNLTSERRRKRVPHTFPALLAWFTAGFEEEMPERIHARGVWVGRPPRMVERLIDGKRRWVPAEDIPPELTGGSALGAPRENEGMRQLIENSPRQSAGDGLEEHYVRPMRAALSRLSGRHECITADRKRHRCEARPLMAHYLFELGYTGGDWRYVADAWDMEGGRGETYTEAALRALWHVYRETPEVYIPPVSKPISDSQANAEAEGVA